MDEPLKFLSLVFGNYLDEANFGVVWINDYVSWSWGKDTQDQAKKVKSKKTNAYFSLGVSSKKLKKGYQEEIEGIAGLGIDLDIKSPVHTRSNLPETIEEAVEFVQIVIPDREPTVIVHTGHGVQAFWIFNEVWMFDNKEEKAKCNLLSNRFYSTVAYQGEKRGWHVDDTKDISHLYRLPGTYNYKKDDPDGKKLTYIYSLNEDRLYNPDSFDDVLIAIDYVDDVLGKKKNVSKGKQDYVENKYGLKIDTEVQPPDELFNMIYSVDEDFVLLWNKEIDERLKKRPTSKKEDVSLSRYDFRLAKIVAKYGWKPQQICDLLIAFRRKHAQTHAEKDKMSRVQYYDRTIQNVMQDIMQDSANADLSRVAQEMKEDTLTNTKRSEEELIARKKEVRTGIKSQLELDIKYIKKYLSEPPQYEIIFEDDTNLMIGESSNLFDQRKFTRIVFDYTNIIINKQKAEEWNKTLKAMQCLIKEVNTSSETRDLEFLESMLNSYVAGSIVGEKEFDEACQESLPFRINSKTYIFPLAFKNYIYLISQEKYTTKYITLSLGRLGCEKVKWNFTKRNQKRSTAHPFNVTHLINNSEEENQGEATNAQQKKEFVANG